MLHSDRVFHAALSTQDQLECDASILECLTACRKQMLPHFTIFEQKVISIMKRCLPPAFDSLYHRVRSRQRMLMDTFEFERWSNLLRLELCDVPPCQCSHASREQFEWLSNDCHQTERIPVQMSPHAPSQHLVINVISRILWSLSFRTLRSAINFPV